MTARARTARTKRGQAMLEYALISATVVMAFAGAAALGADKRFFDVFDAPTDDYYITLHFAGCPTPDVPDCLNAVADKLGHVDEQVRYH